MWHTGTSAAPSQAISMPKQRAIFGPSENLQIACNSPKRIEPSVHKCSEHVSKRHAFTNSVCIYSICYLNSPCRPLRQCPCFWFASPHHASLVHNPRPAALALHLAEWKLHEVAKSGWHQNTNQDRLTMSIMSKKIHTCTQCFFHNMFLLPFTICIFSMWLMSGGMKWMKFDMTLCHLHHLASSNDSREASTLGHHGPLQLPFPCWPPAGSGAGANEDEACNSFKMFQGPILAKPKLVKMTERIWEILWKIYKDLKGRGHCPSVEASQKHCTLLTAAMQPTNSRTLSSSSSNSFQETRWRVWWYFQSS